MPSFLGGKKNATAQQLDSSIALTLHLDCTIYMVVPIYMFWLVGAAPMAVMG
jgi:hypothetical protein